MEDERGSWLQPDMARAPMLCITPKVVNSEIAHIWLDISPTTFSGFWLISHDAKKDAQNCGKYIVERS